MAIEIEAEGEIGGRGGRGDWCWRRIVEWMNGNGGNSSPTK